MSKQKNFRMHFLSNKTGNRIFQLQRNLLLLQLFNSQLRMEKKIPPISLRNDTESDDKFEY